MRIHAIIHGRVQGVFFRASTRDEGQRLNLRGWVKNLPDGTVETAFQGEDSAVREMLSWLHSGPPAARVDRVESREEAVVENESEFRIVYK